jgi:N-carbamoylputrescine amidase
VEENDSPFLRHFSELAKELKVVLPISFFEQKNNAYYNSIVVFDVDGTNVGKYRKTHIPDGPGYQEKFYFTPGDTGFRVFHTAHGTIGVGICWDQWFPETARSLVLNGAELLFFPTAIGSEPKNSSYDSSGHWQRTMMGHAASNMVPIIASNRVGTETFPDSEITFYGELVDGFDFVICCEIIYCNNLYR